MNLITVAYILDSGKMVSVMAVVNKFGLMAHFMKVIGRTMLLMEKEDLSTLMEIFMRVNGKMIKLMDTYLTYKTVGNLYSHGWG